MNAPDPTTEVPAVPDAAASRFALGPMWYLALGGLLVACVAVTLLLTRHGAEVAGPATPELVADAQGLTLPEGAPQWRYLELDDARVGPALAPLPVPGRVEFDEHRTASVGSPLPGRIDQVRVRAGDAVKKGERLFSVRSGAHADLQREHEAAVEEHALKMRVVERTRELAKLQAVPEKDVIAAESDARQAQLTVQGSAAKLASLGVQPDGEGLFWVLAPRDGTVVELDVSAGMEVSSDREKPLLRISDLRELLVLADVQEADLADLQPGAAVRIHPQSGADPQPGVVDRVSEVVDPVRRTVAVRIRAPNSDRRLRPNAFVQVELPAPGGERVHVPESAVVSDGASSAIFVAREKGRLERREIRTGRRRDGEVEVVAGLEPRARYVSRGAILLLNQVELATE